jgi:hypothetical protein
MINALVFGLIVLARQLTLRGEGTPFLVGFEAAGWPAVAAALIAMLGFEKQILIYVRWAEASLSAFWHEFIEWTGEFTVAHWAGIKFGFDVFALATPQLLLALLGGWAAGRLGVSVVRDAPERSQPGARRPLWWQPPCFSVQASGGPRSARWIGAIHVFQRFRERQGFS